MKGTPVVQSCLPFREPQASWGTKNRPKCKALICSEYPTCSYGPPWYTLALKGLGFSPSTTLDGHPAHLWITSRRNSLLRGNIHDIIVPSARTDLLKLRAPPNSIRLYEEVFIPRVFGETHPTTSASNHKATFNWLRKQLPYQCSQPVDCDPLWG